MFANITLIIKTERVQLCVLDCGLLSFKSGSCTCRIGHRVKSLSGFKQNTFMATDLAPWPSTSRWDDSCARGSVGLLVYSCNKGPCCLPNGPTCLVLLTEASGPPSTGLFQTLYMTKFNCIWPSSIVYAHLPKGQLFLMVLLACILPGFMIFVYLAIIELSFSHMLNSCRNWLRWRLWMNSSGFSQTFLLSCAQPQHQGLQGKWWHLFQR